MFREALFEASVAHEQNDSDGSLQDMIKRIVIAKRLFGGDRGLSCSLRRDVIEDDRPRNTI